jgi:hypothetical protein
VERRTGDGADIYILCSGTFFLYGDVGVIRVCTVGANGRTCFGGGEMGYFEFLIL